MCKYIRVKGGRLIDLTNWTKTTMTCIDEDNNVSKDILYQRQWFTYDGDACHIHNESISHSNQVVKEADTIEELCDEAVYFDDKGIPHYKSCTPLWEVSASFYKDTVRYCVFTDEGIIYVAKPNEADELCLI